MTFTQCLLQQAFTFIGAVLGFVLPAYAVDMTVIQATLPTCLACHGEKGASITPNVPSLAGQPDAFLQWQLVYFRSKNRKSDIMGPIAANLKDPEIRALGAYFASLAPAQPVEEADTAPDLSARGKKLAETRRCGSCHGDTFKGLQAAARIANQREDYLNKALADFKDGQRVGGGVAAMPDALYGMSSDDLRALAHYLSRFSPP